MNDQARSQLRVEQPVDLEVPPTTPLRKERRKNFTLEALDLGELLGCVAIEVYVRDLERGVYARLFMSICQS